MDILDIKKRLHLGQPVSQEEENAYIQSLTQDLKNLKETNPTEYLETLNKISSFLEGINNDVKQITQSLNEVH